MNKRYQSLDKKKTKQIINKNKKNGNERSKSKLNNLYNISLKDKHDFSKLNLNI
jgi:hypothetical protein